VSALLTMLHGPELQNDERSLVLRYALLKEKDRTPGGQPNSQRDGKENRDQNGQHHKNGHEIKQALGTRIGPGAHSLFEMIGREMSSPFMLPARYPLLMGIRNCLRITRHSPVPTCAFGICCNAQIGLQLVLQKGYRLNPIKDRVVARALPPWR